MAVSCHVSNDASSFVIPAQAGDSVDFDSVSQQTLLDSRLRGNDANATLQG